MRDPLRELKEEPKAGNVSLGGGGAARGCVDALSGSVDVSGRAPAAGAPATASSASARDPEAPPPQASGAAHPGTLHEAAEDLARDVAQQALSGAGRVLRRGVSEVRIYVETNPYSVTMMSFAGGAALTFLSLFGLMDVLTLFSSPLAYILNGYQLLFGLTICCIDGPGHQLPDWIRQRVIVRASFLHSNVSRVLFYLFIACQQGTMHSVFHFLLGWYFAFIAVAYGGLHLCAPAPAPSA